MRARDEAGRAGLGALSDRLLAWAPRVERELKDGILAFWMTRALDEENGGFVGQISPDGQVDARANKGLVLNARILWCFATAYRTYRDDAFLRTADRAYAYLMAHHADGADGGFFWAVDHRGAPVNDRKLVYGQAFALYALSEYHRATGHASALEQAIELFELLERHARDPVDGGYLEAFDRRWAETRDFTLSGRGVGEAKSANAHLHVLEAYTNLYRVWQDPRVRAALIDLVETFLRRMIDPASGHLAELFDRNWSVMSDRISFGHDIEASWLLRQAAEMLGDAPLLERATRAALQLAEVTLQQGVDGDGGLLNEADARGLVDTGKDWWPQAEALVGFYGAYQLTADGRYAEAALNLWEFIDDRIVDKEHGEWRWSVHRDGTPVTLADKPWAMKVSEWKCPYHNGRACFELLERLAAVHAHHAAIRI